MSDTHLWMKRQGVAVQLGQPYTPPDDTGEPGGGGGDLSPGVWPNASNVGYLGSPGALTNLSGYTVNTNGTVIEGRNISDALVINGTNVTIRNCIISAGWYGVDANPSATGLLVEDCTIIGGANCGIAASASNVTIRRCHLYGGDDGMKIGGSNVTVRDCYIHDLDASGDAHNDGIQCYSGTGLTFYNNWIESPDTSCIAMFSGQGTWNNIVIERNRFIGGGYPLYAGGTSATNVHVLNNTFSDWGYGPYTDWDSSGIGNVWSGNVDAIGNPV